MIKDADLLIKLMMNNSSDYLIAFDSPRLGYGKVVLENPYKTGVPPGLTAIVGLNGSGKTTLGTILEKGRYAYGNRLRFSDSISKVKMLSFTDIHSFTGVDVQYYSQRMEATANDYVATVRDIFKEKNHNEIWTSLSYAFDLDGLLDKKINYLSSGELRKLLIINALCDKPDILIMDNPYIGLDAESRSELDEVIIKLRDSGMSFIMLLCDYSDIPSFIDTLIELDNCKINPPVRGKRNIREWIKNKTMQPVPVLSFGLPQKNDRVERNFNVAFSIENGFAKYGDKVIFEGFNWIVNRGECWALAGPNGSGKSLLLSMICADNPQGYSNKITLFGRRRGSGESIWEIKDSIGYVCPEMQLYFKSRDSVREIIVQGLRNSLNRYHPSSQEERASAEEWMRILDISYLSERQFSELSSGEQRLVLIARALIKQPELLVLDEPLHGLDKNHKERIKRLLDVITRRNGTSLIYVSHYRSEYPECIKMEKKIGSYCS